MSGQPAHHPGSARRAGHQARDSGHDYTRDQVLAAEHWAWAGKVKDGRAEFFYDGINFWRQDGGGATRSLAAWETPSRGWWHMSPCDCPICSGDAKATEAPGEDNWLRQRLARDVVKGENG